MLPFLCFSYLYFTFSSQHWVGLKAWASSCLNQQHLTIQGCTPTLRNGSSFFLFFFLFMYKKHSNSIWDFRCLVTRWLLSSLIGGFEDGSFLFFSFFVQAINCSQTTHGEGSTLMCTTARICSVKPSNLCLAEAVGSAGLWVMGATLGRVSLAGHTFEWADTGLGLCVQISNCSLSLSLHLSLTPCLKALSTCWQTDLRFSSSVWLVSLFRSVPTDRLTRWWGSFSVSLFLFAFFLSHVSTAVGFSTHHHEYKDTFMTIVTNKWFPSHHCSSLFSKYILQHFSLSPHIPELPKFSTVYSPFHSFLLRLQSFLSSHCWKSIFGHTMRAREWKRRQLPGPWVHLDVQRGQARCEDLLFGMSAARCFNGPVYHHCYYGRWLGWPLH